MSPTSYQLLYSAIYHFVFESDSNLRPVAVPGIFVADGAAFAAADRCHSLRSLYPPPAALPSLPDRIPEVDWNTAS